MPERNSDCRLRLCKNTNSHFIHTKQCRYFQNKSIVSLLHSQNGECFTEIQRLSVETKSSVSKVKNERSVKETDQSGKSKKNKNRKTYQIEKTKKKNP